ncbi:hypothetical protein CsatB_015858 [Cannabis sativa]
MMEVLKALVEAVAGVDLVVELVETEVRLVYILYYISYFSFSSKIEKTFINWSVHKTFLTFMK